MKGIWKYSHLLPYREASCRLSLGEGSTPLLKSRRIGPDMGLHNLYFKLENVNPSGSYKDRFAASAVSAVLAQKGRLCLGTSSGNTGAALAAYAALADLPCYLAIVDGAPTGKLKQMQVYGANLWMIRGFGIESKVTETVAKVLASVAANQQTQVQISAYHYSPVGMEGVQTIAYEIAEDLPRVDHVFVPAGGGGLTLAVARGFRRWQQHVNSFRMPRIHCVQPDGNNTIAGVLRQGEEKARSVSHSETKISGLQVASVLDGDHVIQACRESKGNGFLVEDAEVFEAQKLLAIQEGIYCEPAGAVALAGAIHAWKSQEVKADEPMVCLITGHGFKDPLSTDQIIRNNEIQYVEDVNEIKNFFN